MKRFISLKKEKTIRGEKNSFILKKEVKSIYIFNNLFHIYLL